MTCMGSRTSKFRAFCSKNLFRTAISIHTAAGNNKRRNRRCRWQSCNAASSDVTLLWYRIADKSHNDVNCLPERFYV